MGDGVGAELGALLFAVTSEGPPYPGEWLCRRQLAAWRADPAAHRRLLADAPSGPDWAAWREPFFLSGLAYLVIFPSWLAYLFWNKGIATIGATRGEIYTHIIPLSGGVLSILFLHTQPHARHLFSALFIMVGIGICSLEKRQAASIRLRD